MINAIRYSTCCYGNVIDVYQIYEGNHGVERRRWVSAYCSECGEDTNSLGLHEAVGTLLKKVRDLEKKEKYPDTGDWGGGSLI